LPIFAQEKEEANPFPFPFRAIAAGSQLIQQLEAINLKFDEAFNKHDAAAVGALYIPNAVQVTPVGSFSGREAIEGYITDLIHRPEHETRDPAKAHQRNATAVAKYAGFDREGY
jgi:ketosteroid isomerase-like protein